MCCSWMQHQHSLPKSVTRLPEVLQHFSPNLLKYSSHFTAFFFRNQMRNCTFIKLVLKGGAVAPSLQTSLLVSNFYWTIIRLDLLRAESVKVLKVVLRDNHNQTWRSASEPWFGCFPLRLVQVTILFSIILLEHITDLTWWAHIAVSNLHAYVVIKTL